MLTRNLAGLTFEVHAPHQWRLVQNDPRFPAHDAWMLYDGTSWWLSCYVGVNRHDQAFDSRDAIIDLLTQRRIAL